MVDGDGPVLDDAVGRPLRRSHARLARGLGLVARIRPGPFWPRPHECGMCPVVRGQGRPVAMAGNGRGHRAGRGTAPSVPLPRRVGGAALSDWPVHSPRA
ncbi:hypothetical protein SUDANB178_00536 [Streptomyces sp. enrichment culture]